jgi:hypothetical protein
MTTPLRAASRGTAGQVSGQRQVRRVARCVAMFRRDSNVQGLAGKDWILENARTAMGTRRGQSMRFEI